MQMNQNGVLFRGFAARRRLPLVAARVFQRVACALWMGVSATLTAGTIHVAKTGNDTNDGLSWATAKLTVQAGIDTALGGGHETVIVSNGTYQAATLQINGAVVVQSAEGVGVTVLIKASGNQATVNLSDAGAVLDGFTLRSGQNGDGGAIYMSYGTVRNCLIRDNNGIYRGGGVYMTGVLLTNCVLRGNKLLYSSANYGGGAVYMTDGLVVDCVMTNNTAASNRGGAVRLSGGTVRDCLMKDNAASGVGGGIYMNGAGLVQNCLIAGHGANGAGGGVYMTAGVVESGTIAGNVSAAEGGGVRMTGGTLRNCVIAGNTGNSEAARDLWVTGGEGEHCCAIPEVAGDGNIAADPEFMNPVADDYRPRPGSPLVDAGTNQTWMASATDLNGRPRIMNSRVDIGVYEEDATDGALRCNFLASDREGYSSLEVEFTAYAAGSNTTGLAYYWNFGNGTASGADLARVTNTYGPGVYTVSLTVSNAVDESDTLVKTGYIKVGPLTIYVSPAGSNTAPYDSWEKAATDIHFAFAQAGSNDTIYLAGGDYLLVEPLSWTRSFVTVRGSYRGLAPDSPGESDIERWPTVLRRDAAVSYMRVMSIVGVSDGRLEGIAVRDGYSSYSGAQFGGAGIFIQSCSNLFLSGCRIMDNTACYPLAGGGIYAGNSYGTLTNCLVSRNHVDATDYSQNIPGAGLHLDGGGWTVVDSVFSANAQLHQSHPGSQSIRGAGVHVTTGTHHFRNCALYGNGGAYRSTQYGAGMYVLGGAVAADHCTIIGNRSEGVRRAGGTLALTNCVLWGNTADVVGTVVLDHCNVEDGTGNGLNGCISQNPLFERGLYLADESPCRDAGAGNAADRGLDGFTTRTDGTPDSGAADIGMHYAEGLVAPYADLHVALGGDDTHSGADGDNALRTLSRALWKARDGSRIHVAGGTFDAAGGETFPLVVSRPGTEIVGAGRDNTTIDASGAARQAVYVAGTPVESRLGSLTIRGAYAVGVYLSGAGVSAIQSVLGLDGCRIAENEFMTSGNGFADTQHGAGIGMRYADVTLTNCLVQGNLGNATYYTCNEYGAGIGSYQSSLTLLDTVINGNTNRLTNRGYHSVKCYGAGLYIEGGDCLARNVLLVANDCYGTEEPRANWGDGVYITGSAQVEMHNVTVADNSGLGNDPEGLHINDGDVTVRNAILWGNVADVVGTVDLSWSNVEDGTGEGVNGNISADPLFADRTYYHLLSRAGYYEGGYFGGGRWTLAPTPVGVHSPCIDAGARGDPLEREPVPNGNRVNQGAYGNSSVASLSIARGTLILIR